VNVRQRLKIGNIGGHIVLGLIGIIHPIPQIGIPKFLVRVSQSKPVPDLVAHGILHLLIVPRLEIKTVHFGHAVRDVVVSEGY